MPLTDTVVRNTKTGPKPAKLTDGGGLYLLVACSGGKWWRLDYRFGGKRKTLSLGVYPAVSLKEARSRRDEARRLLAGSVDPGEHRKAVKRAKHAVTRDTFEAVAREWYAKQKPRWAPSHAEKIIRRLERDIFPWLGTRPVGELTAPELLTALRRIEERGAMDTAHRAHQNCSQVLRYAIATGRAERDAAADLRGALSPTRGNLHCSGYAFLRGAHMKEYGMAESNPIDDPTYWDSKYQHQCNAVSRLLIEKDENMREISLLESHLRRLDSGAPGYRFEDRDKIKKEISCLRTRNHEIHTTIDTYSASLEEGGTDLPSRSFSAPDYRKWKKAKYVPLADAICYLLRMAINFDGFESRLWRGRWASYERGEYERIRKVAVSSILAGELDTRELAGEVQY